MYVCYLWYCVPDRFRSYVANYFEYIKSVLILFRTQSKGTFTFSLKKAVVDFILFVGSFLNSRKVSVTFILSVRLSACISALPTERIYVKFDIGAL